MKTVLITGAGGYIGGELIKRLTQCQQPLKVIAVDLRAVAKAEQQADITYVQADIRDAEIQDIILKYQPHSVVHLASVVGAGGDIDLDYSIDVLGTENVLKACAQAGSPVKSKLALLQGHLCQRHHHRSEPGIQLVHLSQSRVGVDELVGSCFVARMTEL